MVIGSTGAGQSASLPQLGVPIIRAATHAQAGSFRDQYAISQGQKPAMRSGSAAGGGGGAPPPPPPAAPPPAPPVAAAPKAPPPVASMPPATPLVTPQPFASSPMPSLTEGPSLTKTAPGVEPASAVTASVDMPPWMWAGIAVVVAGVGLGGIYLATRPHGKKRAA